jgi:type III secretion system low calcium response chaperone LcrH/SycD
VPFGPKRPEGTDPGASGLQQWADGRSTLKEVRGYTDEELYAIARAAYFYYHQGKLDQARILFQGLYALSPGDSYAAKALGVVELAAGNFQGAISAFDVAIKLDPEDIAAHVGRAEVRVAMEQKPLAIEDLKHAMALQTTDDAMRRRASQMLELLESELE